MPMKARLFVIFALLTITLGAAAQVGSDTGRSSFTQREASDDQTHNFVVIEAEPQFPGGVEALLNYVASHVKYPALAQNNGVECLVHVKFIVNEDGSIGEAKVVETERLTEPKIMSRESFKRIYETSKSSDYDAYVAEKKATCDEALKLCEAEAVRVVKSLPRFIPGKAKGKAVRVWLTLPLRFQLQ